MCRILSMSGGGSKGAYEAGALHSIFNTLEAPDGEYDVVSGVSVGAINSASMALFAKGEEKALGDYLLGLWMNLTNR
jgi:NTE family protein